MLLCKIHGDDYDSIRRIIDIFGDLMYAEMKYLS
jgi:hypothetical protein